MITSIASLKVGERAKVLKFKAGRDIYRQRLLALGFVPGAEFTVVRVAPLGDPVEIKLNNSFLCLRKHESSIMEIARIESESSKIESPKFGHNEIKQREFEEL